MDYLERGWTSARYIYRDGRYQDIFQAYLNARMNGKGSSAWTAGSGGVRCAPPPMFQYEASKICRWWSEPQALCFGHQLDMRPNGRSATRLLVTDKEI